jgi:peptidoglycan/xylan/chitin deacetylase (PgdA/CDA1 family)
VIQQLDPELRYKPHIEFLSSHELKELSKSPLMTIGSHTHYHQVLTALSDLEAQNDLQKGKELLESWINQPVKHFSYPYGAYNDKIIQLAQMVGFQTGVTTKPNIEKSSIVNSMSISRFEIKNIMDFYKIIHKF